MNSTYVVAVIGAVAGLVTGLGSALVALDVTRSQEATGRELQRRQWFADSLATVRAKSAVRIDGSCWHGWTGGTSSALTASDQHAELMQAATEFAVACTAVRIYAPENVVEPLIDLRNLTFEFDKYAEEHRDRKRWTESQEAEYERFRLSLDPPAEF